jgi:hypothetical protein
VNKPRIYPDLTQEVEGEGPVDDESDDGDDESVDEAGPSKPIKKTRRLRVKGLAPTRQSNRLKERTATNPDSAVVETPPLDDRAVTPMQVSPSSDDDDYISPLPPANAGEEQTCPEDKLDTISVSVPAQPSPKVDVKPLPRLPLVPPPPHPPVDSKRRIVPKPPSEPTKLEPKEFKMEKKETPNPVERSTLTYQQHFHNMYRFYATLVLQRKTQRTAPIWLLISYWALLVAKQPGLRLRMPPQSVHLNRVKAIITVGSYY